MKIFEILTEKPVSSSWIDDISYDRPKKTITLRLGNGKKYQITAPTRTTFEKWVSSFSKGQYFHFNIKDEYNIRRIL